MCNKEKYTPQLAIAMDGRLSVNMSKTCTAKLAEVDAARTVAAIGKKTRLIFLFLL